MQVALLNTLRLAGLCMLIATPIGVAMAIGLQRWRGRVSNAANGLMLVPIVTPEIVFGVALFLVFSQVTTGFPDGLTRQLLGHITFTISFVVVIIRRRLAAIGTQYGGPPAISAPPGCRQSGWCCCHCSARPWPRA